MDPLDNHKFGPKPRVSIQALAWPRLWQPAWPLGLTEWRNWFAGEFARDLDQRRLFPWLAVCFGIGILLYFQAEGRPALWAPLSALALCVGMAVAMRHRLVPLAVLVGLATIFAGFASGILRTRLIEAPVLQRITIAPLSGFIEAIEDRPEGRRVLLRVVDIKGVAPDERPHRVRVSVRKGEALTAGLFITGNARLLPPPQPAWPGGYDFGRDAFYRGIGGVGSMLGAPKVLAPRSTPPWSLQLAASVDEARNVLTTRIATAIGGAAGGVGAALVTGKRGLIPEPTNDVLRSAGIYHIVSISGLHMVLAAGTFFWLARALLSLVPALALHWPVKKIAALVAMAGASGYCVFSGADVATVRSLIMSLVMFGAVLVDRPALSIRNLAIAAILVLAREPEALLGPSFQMSFGAVAALTAFVPILQAQRPDHRSSGMFETFTRWMTRHAVGLLATTLVASVATAPFAAYHFQTVNPYGLVGNALALPLVSLVVMPAAVLGVLAYPFGLDGPIWRVMGEAVSRVLEVSGWVGGFDGSSIVIPALGAAVLALAGTALLIAALPASGLRYLAVVPAAAGLALAATPTRPDIFVDRDGQGAAIRGEGGKLVLVGRASTFVVGQWLRADGDNRDPAEKSLREDARCDGEGCVVVGPERRHIAFVQNSLAFAEDCRRAEIVITQLKAPPNCQSLLVLDRNMLAARGATSIRFSEAGLEILSVKKGAETLARTPLSAQSPKTSPSRAWPLPEQDLPEDDEADGPISTDEPD